MTKKLSRALVLSILLITNIQTSLYCQQADSKSFNINSRLSFYSFEKDGEFLLQVPSEFSQQSLSINVAIGNTVVASQNGKPGRNILRLPFSINLAPGVYKAEAKIVTTASSGVKYEATTELVVLSYKPNEVKTDRLTGGLIVNRRPFFPFGFYCYSPVSTLPEEEVVKGFNMISPYQKILPETLNERKDYMDRCAKLGMKVHYNLLSVSGGGGVGSKIEGLSDQEKRARLVAEIKTFRDHPALLAWYISDEPNAFHIPPEKLEEIYRTVKENDPWHPVSIVFTAPFLDSKKYVNALDIVMADPYPIPVYPVTRVEGVTKQLTAEFKYKKPVWMVIQSFGGGEWWGREPTIQEIRSMTWQAIIKGSSAIQYFVRQGPSSFPKSTAAWNECGRMSIEIAELTPWLLSDEETLPVESYSKNVIVTSRLHDGQLLVMAVNKVNEPAGVTIKIKGVRNGNAQILFENRSVSVSGGSITDHLAPFGSQVYLIDLDQKQSSAAKNSNLIRDPGFEDTSSPGVPAACYARNGGGKGATFFLDTREHFEGNHSLRLVTPKNDNSIKLRFFPISVMKGQTYFMSVWAKTDPDQRSAYQAAGNNPQFFEVSFGEFGTKRFNPGCDWKQFVTSVTIPYDNGQPVKTNIILQMPSAGVAWFDMLQVVEAIDIKECINPEFTEEWNGIK
ncbi:MAG: hypothetical protein LLG13_16040 [Bacteroidales bacterium]|nr:hypothetical protein [Bacteroidales bacterium]